MATPGTTIVTGSSPLDLSGKWPVNSDDVPDNGHFPASCGARQVNKLKRYLTTIQQVAMELSPATAEKVRYAILAFINGSLSAEQFQQQLQTTLRFPARPFLPSFLETSLPYLQRELMLFGRYMTENPDAMFTDGQMACAMGIIRDQSVHLDHPGVAPGGASHAGNTVQNLPANFATDQLSQWGGWEELTELFKRWQHLLDDRAAWSAKEVRNLQNLQLHFSPSRNGAIVEAKRRAYMKKSDQMDHELDKLCQDIIRHVAMCRQLSVMVMTTQNSQFVRALGDVQQRQMVTAQIPDRMYS